MSFTPKVVKHVTLPTLKLVEGAPVYVKITSPMHLGKGQEAKDGQEAKQPPVIVDILQLVLNEKKDGLLLGDEPMQLVLGTVVQSELQDEYQEDTYVNKCFMIEKGKKKDKPGGRGYFTYSISEIEAPTQTVEDEAEARKAAEAAAAKKGK